MVTSKRSFVAASRVDSGGGSTSLGAAAPSSAHEGLDFGEKKPAVEPAAVVTPLVSTYTVTFNGGAARPVRLGVSPFGAVSGTIAIASYVQVAGAGSISQITGLFTNQAPLVNLDGLSSNGYLVCWDTGSKSVKAWLVTTAGAAATEAGAAANVGSVGFSAIGTVSGI